jgi:hypothetical protein
MLVVKSLRAPVLYKRGSSVGSPEHAMDGWLTVFTLYGGAAHPYPLILGVKFKERIANPSRFNTYYISIIMYGRPRLLVQHLDFVSAMSQNRIIK